MSKRETLTQILAPNSAKNWVAKVPLGFEEDLFGIQKGINDATPLKNRGMSTQALAVLILTGCKAIELERGVKVALRGEGCLHFLIHQTLPKKSKGKGDVSVETGRQMYRHLVIPNPKKSAAGRFLYEYLSGSTGAHLIKLSTDRQNDLFNSLLSTYVRLKKKKVLVLQITQQFFRYLLVSKMVAADFSVEDMCNVLGIRNRTSLLTYAVELHHHREKKGFIVFYKGGTAPGAQK